MTTPWQQTIPIDETLAQQLIASQFPEITIKSFRYLGEGWDNKVYLINDELVFRFPRRHECALECMQKEIGIMTKLASFLPLPVSFPVYIGQACEQYPHPFAGYDYLPGKPISEIGLDTLPATDLLEKLALFLKALHSVPVDNIGAEIPDDPMKMDYADRSARMINTIEFIKSTIDIPYAQKLLDIVKNLKSAFPLKSDYCIVHGDLYSRHVLLEGNKVSGIIDWGDIHMNTPAIDLSVLYTLFPAQYHDKFWEIYGPVSEQLQQQAIFRAIYSSVLMTRYAIDQNDNKLLQVSLQSLDYIQSEPER